MAIKDILLPLVGEPDAAAIAAIDKCMAVAGDFGARVTAMAVEEDILVRPKVDDFVRSGKCGGGRRDAQRIGRPRPAEGVRRRGKPLWRSQRTAAQPAGFGGYSGEFRASLRGSADLSMVPVKPDDGRSEKIAERLIFESGRPILMCPEERVRRIGRAFRSCHDRVGSHRAGRASRRRCAAVASGRRRCAHRHGNRRQDAGANWNPEPPL